MHVQSGRVHRGQHPAQCLTRGQRLQTRRMHCVGRHRLMRMKKIDHHTPIRISIRSEAEVAVEDRGDGAVHRDLNLASDRLEHTFDYTASA